ncbi:MAG: hypothetical protein J6Q13_01500 [Clostridia bacterium]|nr:hypothetical protein [Clostridia bacterium]
MAKKIGAIVSLSIIGVLILATIIMANVNVDYSINCATPTHVYYCYGGGTEIDTTENSAAIVDYINNSSKEKSLTALFNGNLNKKAKVVAASSVGKTLSYNSNTFYVRFHYENPQKLMEGKKEYKDANGNAVLYEELVFTVANLEGSNVVNVYVIPDSTSAKTYTYYYELEADFTELYAFLNEQYNNN